MSRNSRGYHSNDDPLQRLSKTLSYLLRHGAVDAELPLTPDGYANVGHLLQLPQFKGCTEQMIRDVVAADAKTRYSLRETDRILEVCANQGHSLAVEVALTAITSAADCPQALHGTYARFMESILREGLKPMTRQHIHFSKREPTEKNDVSGIRKNCNVLIYLDVEKVLRDGIPLFESANGVILSPGNAAGCIPAEYFLKVLDRNSRTNFVLDKNKKY
ncbi:putative tRNA 2'-phosphotransferase 1 [Hypsibius exemplaris]|uniref:2'-phosphotransferase n=1 Tax=Hypsibius exemplaris TaxID=2072580 RepID=A0A1W0WP53_HYPEX|nr:putative tRNA 2'-phosphotransferase 1 [Hypsibius exemplaris]